MSKNDGGPAFATTTTVREVQDIQRMQQGGNSAQYGMALGPIPTVTQISTTGGMSLRDYFAAAALQISGALVLERAKAGLPALGGPLETYAIGAYNIADAMLAERSK